MQAEMRSVLLAKAVNTAHPIELTGDECRTFHQTNPSGAEPEKWDLPDLTHGNLPDRGLDSCQYLEHGKCWWFASKEDNITPRPGSQLTHRMPMLFARSGTPPSPKKVKVTMRKTPAAEEQTNFSARRPNTVRIQTSTQMLHKTKMCFTILSSQHPLLKLGLTWTTSLRS